MFFIQGGNLYHQDAQRDLRPLSSKELQSEHQTGPCPGPCQQMLQSSQTLLSQNIRAEASQKTNHNEMVFRGGEEERGGGGGGARGKSSS